MGNKTQPPGFRIEFPEPEMFWAVRDTGKPKQIEVNRLSVMSDTESVSVMYGGEAANVAKNRIQLPLDADFLRELADKFSKLADELE
jgi:hypothetical protein